MKKFLAVFKDIDWNEVNVGVWVRYVLAFLTSINTCLTMAGQNPIPVSDTMVYAVVSIVLNIIIIFYNTYHNNSTSKEAIVADLVMNMLKNTQSVDEKKALIEQVEAIVSGVAAGTKADETAKIEEAVKTDAEG